MNSPLSYKDAGVDIDAGDRLIDRIKPMAQRTTRAGVLQSLGGFGALFEVPSGYSQPVLVSGTDGVGTKLRVAFELQRHDTIGIDLVAMSVNDILVLGAEPLYFLDYFACGQLDVDTAATVVSGIARGCELSGCALIGGETAEMPGMYQGGEYDLAGFAVGIVEKSRIIDGRTVREGDVLIGLPSSGPHANGYSLIRRIIERELGGLHAPDLQFDLSGTMFADALMAPTRLYVKPVLALVKLGLVQAMAHITGGGLVENVPRVLPETVTARIDSRAWQRPALFDWLQQKGAVADDEMHRVFNCGIGMVLVVRPGDSDAALDALTQLGESAAVIGEVSARKAGQPAIVVA